MKYSVLKPVQITSYMKLKKQKIHNQELTQQPRLAVYLTGLHMTYKHMEKSKSTVCSSHGNYREGSQTKLIS